MPTNFPHQTQTMAEPTLGFDVQNQIKKYKEEEKTHRAPQELPFDLKSFNEVISQIYDRFLLLNKQLEKLKNEPSAKVGIIGEIQDKLKEISIVLMIEIPESVDKLEL